MMASNTIKAPFLKAVASRNYGTKANPCGAINKIKTSVLPNKVVVASADSGSPLARVSVVFRAGSRYECPDSEGAAHMLRIAAGLSTKQSSHFAIVRNIQQVGASLTCTATRETIAYTLEGTYEAVENCSQYLSDVATQQVFKPWELSDSLPRLKLDLARLPLQVKAMNFLHRAAYRTGLGNSLFVPGHKVGKVSSETLQHYVANNFMGNRAAVVGLGIGHSELKKYAENMCLECGNENDNKSCYYGGEIRSEKGGNLAYVAIAGEAASLSNQKDAIAFNVLQRVYGIGPYVQYGNESSGLFSKAIGEVNVGVSAINVAYTDSGLFGAMLIGPDNSIKNAVVNVAKTLRSAAICDEDVERAKNQLKTSAFLDGESGTNFITMLGNRSATIGSCMTPEQYVEAVNKISLADVKKVAAQVAQSSLSMASVGSIKNVPYLDSLC